MKSFGITSLLAGIGLYVVSALVVLKSYRGEPHPAWLTALWLDCHAARRRRAAGDELRRGARVPGAELMDDRPRYMISVAAELVGMHPQTLRVYEEKGLVRPQRTAGNTRLYSEADLERLRLIQRLTTELGLNLAGVEAVLELEAEVGRMQARMERLEREMRDAIQQVHRQYRRELVLYDPTQLPAQRRWTSTS